MSSKAKPWPEILFWTGALLVIAALVIPGFWQIRIRRQLAMVHSDLRALTDASEAFFVEYGHWPTALMGRAGEARFGDRRSNAKVLNPLRAVAGPGNEEHHVNPNQIVFLRVEPYSRGKSGLNEQGEFLDPWGEPYQIVLDTELDNVVRFPRSIYRPLIGAGMAAWSYGPDRKPDSPEDILSWTE